MGSFYERYVKRGFDIIAASAGTVILSPVMAGVAIWIKLDSPGPVIFRQKRVGRGKSHFYIYKFRTMRADTPKDMATHLLTDPSSRITRAGRILRRTSLDELPQLVNILLGSMSVVGPRPALYNQYDLIAERDKYGVNELRPGLTGWAQVNGRDEVTIDEKAKLDAEYAKNLSLSMDMRCIWRTFSNVFSGKGYREGGNK